ncbi:hypothetical protein BC828DRAFT_122525 [Blastocladiella britannica]|nr:hypothetical protein BC828DRAFT_122525 [Blastocladiella britannica]
MFTSSSSSGSSSTMQSGSSSYQTGGKFNITNKLTEFEFERLSRPDQQEYLRIHSGSGSLFSSSSSSSSSMAQSSHTSSSSSSTMLSSKMHKTEFDRLSSIQQQEYLRIHQGTAGELFLEAGGIMHFGGQPTYIGNRETTLAYQAESAINGQLQSQTSFAAAAASTFQIGGSILGRDTSAASLSLQQQALIKSEQETLQLLGGAGTDFVGPFIKFADSIVTERSGEAIYSVLVVAKPGVVARPNLRIQLAFGPTDATRNIAVREPELLDSFAGFKFWRSVVRVPMSHAGTIKLEYIVDRCGSAVFAVPGVGEQFKWAYAHGNRLPKSADRPFYRADQQQQGLWKDVLQEHAADAFHGLVAGGKQISTAHILELPSIKEWLSIGNVETKTRAAWTDAMNLEAHQFFFAAYMRSFTANGFRQALSAIPTIQQWDDSDIFEGFGALTREMQATPVLRGLFVAAQRFHLLFAQHSTLLLARNPNSPVDNLATLSRRWRRRSVAARSSCPTR